MKVYLAGPINGCTDDEATNWRDVAKELLGPSNCIDPMRRDYRGVEDQHVHDIVNGDINDIKNSDVMIANCWKPSVGTSMEIWAAMHEPWGCPTVIVVPEGARISPWLRYTADRIVHNIEDAVEAASVLV